MILMDKMKESSSAIQPAFGYTGGFNGFVMLQQVFNTVPLISLSEDDDSSDSPIYLPPTDNDFFTAANQQPQQATPGTVANALQQSFAATEQAYQNTDTLDQQTQLSVAEMVANAVEQQIIAHHNAHVESDNPQPTQSIAQLVANAIQQSAIGTQHPEINITGMIGDLQFQVIANVSAEITTVPTASQQQHAAPSNQSQENVTGLLGNAYQNHVTAAQPSLISTDGMNAYQPIMTEMFSNGINSVPLDAESNSPIPFHAPVSSPDHQYFFGNDFTASDDEGYAPSVASNIIIIDSAGNSDSVDENQMNNPNVPNQSS